MLQPFHLYHSFLYNLRLPWINEKEKRKKKMITLSVSIPQYSTCCMSSGKRIVNLRNTTCATSGEGSPHLPEHLSLPPGFWWGSCGSVFSFLCTIVCLSVFCRLAIVLSVLQFTSYNYSFDIIKHFIQKFIYSF